MSLIEAFVYNGIDKGRAMKQQSLIVMAVILFRHLFSSVTVFTP